MALEMADHMTEQCVGNTRNNSSCPPLPFALIAELLPPTLKRHFLFDKPIPIARFPHALLHTDSPDSKSANVMAVSALPPRRLFLDLHSRHPRVQPFLHPHKKQSLAPTLCQVLYRTLRIQCRLENCPKLETKTERSSSMV